jgi:hypothetical protein
MQYGFYSNNIIKFGPYKNYTCNAHGYRTHEFDDWSNYCLLLGESNVFGIDVPNGKTVSEQLELQVKEKIYNLGLPGGSCEECVRILYSFGETPAPKKVIIVWPYFLRRNYQDLDKMERITGSHKADYTKYIAHNTKDMDVAHFLQQVFFAEQWCAWRRVDCYHFLVSKQDKEFLLANGKTFENLFLDSFENHAQDLGDVGGHFGTGAHRAFANYIKTSCF